MRSMNVKAARPAVFFLCAVLLTLAGCQDVFRSSATLRVSEGKIAGEAAASIPRCTVTFDAGEGSVSPAPVPVTSGSSLGFLPEAPTKEGHTFGHWYTSEGGKEEPFTGSTPVTADITVHAKWLTKACTITFDAAGGSVSPQFQSVDHNTPLGVLLPTPVRSGHTFDGWYTSGGEEFTAYTPVTENITVHARWTPQYTVTFDTDGGSAAPDPVTVTSGSSLGFLPPAPAKTGHTFGHWTTLPDGGGEPFTASTPVTGHMIVYARWTVNQYTVTFNAGEGSVSPESRTVNYNTPLGSLSEPTKTGYTFGGWYTGQNGSGDLFTASTPVTESKTVYARWIPQYTVTFNAAGGDPATQTRTVTGGLPIGSLPAAPTKTGHTFGGWYTAANGGGDPFTASTAVTADITVHAKWLINAYTVTFNAAGGSVSPESQAADHNTTLGALLPTPTKPGHTFGGWYTSGGTQFTASTAVTADITIYAKWTINQYTVTFDAAGGSVSPSARTVNYNTTLGTLPTPTKTEHTFGGWFPNANGGDEFTDSTPVTADITVYARWTINQYTVTFDAAGGSVSPATRTVNYNTPLGALLPAPARTDHTFDGWYTAANGGGDPFTVSTAVTADITVYAKWLATVRFNTDGGSAAPPPVTVAIGSSMHSLPQAPTKEGYTFGGWYTDRDGGGTQFTASTTVTGSKTVYAKWIPRYTVTFNAGTGGSVSPSSRTVTSGNQIGDLPVPTRNDWYTFGGWYTAADGGGTQVTASTPVTKNMTVYAKWNTSLQTFLGWVNSNAVPGGNYTYTLKSDESIAPATFRKNVRITIQGDSQERIVSLSRDGDFFQLYSGITLTLGENLTLKGKRSAPNSVIHVGNEGTLVMNAGAKICDNGRYSSLPRGAGVYVEGGGTFTMNGGTISGNEAEKGGGVYVNSGGTFTLNNGTITGNEGRHGYGGGVYVNSGGTFTLNNGTITGNEAEFGYGGGVYVEGTGMFTMNGGTISGNTADRQRGGGGVYVAGGGTFNQKGGTISGNNPNDIAR